ncbi:hypothetical protein LTR37_017249 [Vermiconidia calcicola]|uniref:Uncharacterized protein n=1 Tax=Vermiconidia calcicola TaxID=1690605 RepID=A0ACC3MLB6_9PEZI|nr:hypothetical protein LTR37_017249 [Vermiconidia calcicola]
MHNTSILLPSNRAKLRNLTSLSLRNLSLEPNGRQRRKTIVDDDAVPQTLKSPAKMVALREGRNMRLEHSRSSGDLRTVGEEENAAGSPTKNRAVKERPKIGRMRRRSTLEWNNATPQRRQERLERVTEERMMDVFYSLHVGGIEEPIYISETVERTMNPTFRHIDFSSCGPGIMRLERVVVRVWVRSVKMGAPWRQLLELDVDLLGGLQWVGKSLDTLTHPLQNPNTLLFHMTDGIYTLPPPITPPQPQRPVNRSTPSARPHTLATSPFDALLRLAKLDDSIQDALTTRNKLASDLENLLQSNREALEDRDRVAEAEDRLKTIEFAKVVVGKQVEKGRKQVEEKRGSLDARRRLMREDVEWRAKEKSEMEDTIRPEIPALKEEKEVHKKAIRAQRRRICEDVQKIYPLTPIPKKSLAFTIRDLHLPNSEDLDSEAPETVAAALGYTAHALLLLSHYLHSPLPYSVEALRGSTTTISDTISKLSKTTASGTEVRTYPLYSKGVPRFRFEYAVFLLNKDIQLLLESCFGVRVLDVRQTLPNLKYLLYMATAGEGELPARKAGGVRGLMYPGRSASDASNSSARSGLLWPKEAANGKVVGNKGAVESLRKNITGVGKKG